MDWRSPFVVDRRLVLTGIFVIFLLGLLVVFIGGYFFGVGLGPDLVRMRMWTENFKTRQNIMGLDAITDRSLRCWQGVPWPSTS